MKEILLHLYKVNIFVPLWEVDRFVGSNLIIEQMEKDGLVVIKRGLISITLKGGEYVIAHFLEDLRPTINPYVNKKDNTKDKAIKSIKLFTSIINKNPLLSGIIGTVVGGIILYFLFG